MFLIVSFMACTTRRCFRNGGIAFFFICLRCATAVQTVSPFTHSERANARRFA
jgi:hypothetical protein